MKRIEWLLSLGLLLALFAVNAYAASPREQLKQMVEQLQKNPGDTALREKIIKLAQKLKPTPAAPEEVERHMARGEAAFEAVKDVNGYADAMREFQAASNLAPWYSDAYFNLGIAQEKAGKAKEAITNFRFYLLAAPDGKDAADVKKRIYKLEYAVEQASKVAFDAANKVAHDRAEQEYLSGRWKYLDGNEFDKSNHSEFHMEGDALLQEVIFDRSADPFVAGQHLDVSRWSKVREKVFQYRDSLGHLITIEFDGDTLIQTSEASPNKGYYKREK